MTILFGFLSLIVGVFFIGGEYQLMKDKYERRTLIHRKEGQ